MMLMVCPVMCSAAIEVMIASGIDVITIRVLRHDPRNITVMIPTSTDAMKIS